MIYWISGEDVKQEEESTDAFHPDDAFGGVSEEDYVHLMIGPRGVLLAYVTGRDVDEQISIPPNLTMADFEGEAETRITDIKQFQQLVDQYFPNMGQNVQEWFNAGFGGD